MALHDILGHLFALEDKVKLNGLNNEYCVELSLLISKSLKEFTDEELENELIHFNTDLIMCNDMQDPFDKLMERGIVNISNYQYPLNFDDDLF
jgi:hypothetical protein